MSEEDDEILFDEVPCDECGAQVDEEHEADCPNRDQDDDEDDL